MWSVVLTQVSDCGTAREGGDLGDLALDQFEVFHAKTDGFCNFLLKLMGGCRRNSRKRCTASARGR